MNKPVIQIGVVSDVVCPWCYIGKRRLDNAIKHLSDKYNFQVQYFPFELNSQIPLEGVNHKEYLIGKFGSEARYDQLTANVTNVAATEGLTFDYKKQSILPNTRNAHRLIQLALQAGKQSEMVEALFKAYFTNGVILSKTENLAAIASEVGLDRNKVEKFLMGDEGLQEVIATENQMQQLGITGVPFYIINNKYGVSGAQPTDSFIDTFIKIASEVEVTATGESCDVDQKNC